jgi:hypothetical protein
MLGIFPARNAAAVAIGGLGAPSSHPDLAQGSIIDFEANTSGEAAISFGYPDVSMTGNNLLRITDSYDGSFNVTGNSMALTANDRTEAITFNFSSPVDAFGFNFGGADKEWRLIAYSTNMSILDELAISPFGNSNNGEWFGISAPGIASARLYNTAFDIGSNTGTPDYVVIDNFTYANAVPEPGTFLLMGLGLAGLGLSRPRRQGQR